MVEQAHRQYKRKTSPPPSELPDIGGEVNLINRLDYK